MLNDAGTSLCWVLLLPKSTMLSLARTSQSRLRKLESCWDLCWVLQVQEKFPYAPLHIKSLVLSPVGTSLCWVPECWVSLGLTHVQSLAVESFWDSPMSSPELSPYGNFYTAPIPLPQPLLSFDMVHIPDILCISVSVHGSHGQKQRIRTQIVVEHGVWVVSGKARVAEQWSRGRTVPGWQEFWIMRIGGQS